MTPKAIAVAIVCALLLVGVGLNVTAEWALDLIVELRAA